MVFFDVADTLLVKKGIAAVYNNVLGSSIDELKILHAVRRVFDQVQVPDHPLMNFYIDFNKQVISLLGINDIQQSQLESISEGIKSLSWHYFSVKEREFIRGLDAEICIISNWGDSLREKLKLNFEREFSHFVISSEIECQKPDLRIYESAYTLSDKSFPIYVGDSIKLDIIPAEKVGFRAILIDRFNYYPEFNGEKISCLTQLDKLL